MADSLRLRIYTPESELFDGTVREVTGARRVRADRDPAGPRRARDHARAWRAVVPAARPRRSIQHRLRLNIGCGFTEVRDNVVTVLADSGEAVA
jgi:F0F1-type ATP synthase epsilon subunit